MCAEALSGPYRALNDSPIVMATPGVETVIRAQGIDLGDTSDVNVEGASVADTRKASP
jgi:hypothetical protein